MAADAPPRYNMSLESVFANAKEDAGTMTHDRARMFLTSGDPPPDGPDDADLDKPDYKQYLAYIALQIGVTGGAKTQSTTEPGYKRYFKTQFRTYQKDGKNPKLPSFEHWCATLKTGVADFAPEADFGTDNQSSVPDPNHKYAVTFPPDDIGPALMALLSTHTLPDAGAVAMAISAAKPETVGTMVQEAFGYDMTDMFADFPTDTFDVAAWSKFVFLVSGGLVSSHLAIRHLASYMRTASADAGEARAGMLKKCMAAAAAYFTRENIPRAVKQLEALLAAILPAADMPLEKITTITDVQRQAIYENMVWFDLNNLPTAADDPYEVTGLVLLENMATKQDDGSYTVSKGDLEALFFGTAVPLPVGTSTPARTERVDNVASGLSASSNKRLTLFKRAHPNDSPVSKEKYRKELHTEITSMEARQPEPGAPTSTTGLGGGSGAGPSSAPATIPPSTSTSTTPGGGGGTSAPPAATGPDVLNSSDRTAMEDRAHQITVLLQDKHPSFESTGSDAWTAAEHATAAAELAENIKMAVSSVTGFEKELRAMSGTGGDIAAAIFLHNRLCTRPVAISAVTARVKGYPVAGSPLTAIRRQAAIVDNLAHVIGPATLAPSSSMAAGGARGGAAVGGAHEVITLSGAQEELVRRSLLKNASRATAEHLSSAMEYINRNHPPVPDPASGLPNIAPFSAAVAVFAGQDGAEISKTVNSEEFLASFPQTTALRNLHITPTHVVNQPEFGFMRKLQQWAFSSLQAFCVLNSLDRLISSESKMLAIVFGDWSAVTFDDFNFGEMFSYIGSSTKQTRRFADICSHIVDVMTLTHPVLGRTALTAQMDIIAANIDKAVDYEEYGEEGVSEAKFRQLGVDAINRFFIDLGRLVDQSRIVTLAGAPPVSADDVIKLSYEPATGTPEWQSNDRTPIFASLMQSASALLTRAVTVKRRANLVAALETPPPKPGAAKPTGAAGGAADSAGRIPKKQRVAGQTQEPGDEATPNSGLLNHPRKLSSQNAFRRVATLQLNGAAVHAGITVIDPAAQGKNSHNVCIQEGASKDGCPKCTYGSGGTKGSCGTCTKAHLSGSAADNWQEPTAERRDLNWGIFSKHYAVGGIAGKGPVGPDGKSHCASMETYAKMPVAPQTDKGKGGRGKGARGGARGRGGGRGA